MSKKGVTPGSVKTVSDNEHGNVYHDKNGLMTSPENGVSSDVEELGGDFDLTDEGEFAGLELDFDLTDEGEFAELEIDFDLEEENQGPIGGLSDDEVLEKIEEVKSILNNDDLVSNIASESLEDKITFLSNVYDEDLLRKASEQEIELLSLLEALKGQKNEILNEQVSLEKQQFVGIWAAKIVTVKDYLEKKDTIEAKRKYYQEQLALINSKDIESQEWLKNKLKSLDLFEKLGKKYEILRDKYFSLSSVNLNDYQEFSKKFINENSSYSEFRKNNAIWINTGNIQKNVKESLKKFAPEFQKMWNSMSYEQQGALLAYTGSYHKFNEPLRLMNYKSYYSIPQLFENTGGDFVKSIKNITEAINHCVWNEDIWIQRGIESTTPFIKNIKQLTKGKSLHNMSDEELEALIGTTFEDQGFFSGGAAKDTGFNKKTGYSSKNLILNVYCPKGTKMAYMNTEGHYSNSDENEMILQRGYSYRITKIEKTGSSYDSMFYIDCEVILGSDENKWNPEELLEIQNKHFIEY